jgi:polyphosphate kinase 2
MDRNIKKFEEFTEEYNISERSNVLKGIKTFGKNLSTDFKKFTKSTIDNWNKSFSQHKLKDDVMGYLKDLEESLSNFNKLEDGVDIPENISKQRSLKILEDNIDKIRLELTPGEISLLGLDTLFRKLKRKLELEEYDISKTLNNYTETLDYRISKLVKYRVENDGNIEDEISKLTRKEYEEEKLDLQEELLKLQEYVIREGKRVAIVFEGRDSAGKGSSIKRFVEYMIPNGSKIVALGIPTGWEKNNWFKRYEKHLPNPGEIVFFDRSWYNRAVVEPVMGYCTEDQYNDFMDNVVDWEESLIDDGLILIKLWFSITQDKQLLRFDLRKQSRVKYWKFSENDLKSVNKWEEITKYKEVMFDKTATNKTPWVVIDSNDKKIARLNAMRYVLQNIDYPDKDMNIKPFNDVVHVIK